MDKSFRKKFLKRKSLGQSTAEYLIILILVSISSIGIMSLFGQTIRQQLSTIVAAFTGSDTIVKENEESIKNLADKAKDRSKKGVTMKGIDSEEIKAFEN